MQKSIGVKWVVALVVIKFSEYYYDENIQRGIIPVHESFHFQFQSDIRILMNFTEDLNNASSSQFKSLASTIEKGILPKLKERLSYVEAVSVYEFKEGSVIGLFYVISEASATVNETELQTDLKTLISSDSSENIIPGLKVDTTYEPTVQSKYLT